MRGRTSARLIVRQALVGSLLAWCGVGIAALCIHFFGGRSWPEAVHFAADAVILLTIGYGAVGLGGGNVVVPSRVFGRVSVEKRDRVTDNPGGLTPLGVALVILPQLVALAVVVTP